MFQSIFFLHLELFLFKAKAFMTQTYSSPWRSIHTLLLKPSCRDSLTFPTFPCSMLTSAQPPRQHSPVPTHLARCSPASQHQWNQFMQGSFPLQKGEEWFEKAAVQLQTQLQRGPDKDMELECRKASLLLRYKEFVSCFHLV